MGFGVRGLRKQIHGKYKFRDKLCKIYDVEPFLLLLAEPDARVLVWELFLARLWLISLQVGAGMALQGPITQVSTVATVNKLCSYVASARHS